MTSLIKIFSYLLGAVFLGALVAPVAYWLFQLLPVDHLGYFAELVASVQQMPLHRYLSRSIQVVAILLLWPTISWLRIRHLSELGLYRNRYTFPDFGVGMIAALLPLFLLQGFLLWKGWYHPKEDLSFAMLPRIVTTAIFVALFEEFFFRGVILGLMRHFLQDWGSIVLSACLFAGIHFLNLPHSHEVSVHWWSGFALLSTIGGNLPAWPLALGAFMTLLIVGMILAWVTIRTGALSLAIGLHASWIFGQQFFNLLTHFTINPPNAWLPWLGPSQIYGMVPVGLLTLVPFGITGLLLWYYLEFVRKNVFSGKL
ncbi:MAG: hypothetical protein A3F67_07945 [Verrucomicrobia bacterium RIFCSPHIGHO2_12_FULL_41_10]|nr:MAG: hypothetical protein A3F67_07945 [Verrucomicrobia bacterium RIFCSPHIGHO2_12_FULL_41_10]